MTKNTQMLDGATFRECWAAIERMTGIDYSWMGAGLRKRINGALRSGVVARAGAKVFEDALFDTMAEEHAIRALGTEAEMLRVVWLAVRLLEEREGTAA
jgi:hypothetical protein